jgi:hypothetical protein
VVIVSDAEEYRPSGFMRNALVAQRVFQELDDSALTDIPLGDPYDWTELLGEQMGVRLDYRADLHSVLLFMLPEIQRLLNPWPPPQAQQDWVPLAEAATQGLTALQMYAALMAGPGRWLKGSIAAGTAESLPEKLRQLLVRSLASELAGVMTRWEEWNIRNLRDRREALIAEREEHKRKEREAKLTEVKKKPIPPPPPRRFINEGERADARRSRPDYTPPGRT